VSVEEHLSPSNSQADLRVSAMDMHVHTLFSDGEISVEELIVAAANRRMGFAVCDHNEIRGSMALWESGQVVTIPAIEIGSRERFEFLLYFPDPESLEDYFVQAIEPYKRSRYYTILDRSFTKLVPQAKEFGAVIALAHPFAPGWKNFNYNVERKTKLLAPEVFQHIDMIEVINSHVADSRNFKAFMLSEIFDKSVTAGSDAHRLNEVGAAYLSFDRELNAQEIYAVLNSRIKVGSESNYRFSRTVGTSRGVIYNHLKLYFSKKDQQRWMIPYDSEEPDGIPRRERRSGKDRRRSPDSPSPADSEKPLE